MAPRPILIWPDARLTQTCAPCVGDRRALAADMLDTMYAAAGRGLAAPQIGVLERIFVMDATWKTGADAPEVFINPEILWRSEEVAPGPEGCLSIPGVLAVVPRHQAINLRWTGLDGSVTAARLSGFRAICAQHEMDHLDGVLTLDHLSPSDRARAQADLHPAALGQA